MITSLKAQLDLSRGITMETALSVTHLHIAFSTSSIKMETGTQFVIYFLYLVTYNPNTEIVLGVCTSDNLLLSIKPTSSLAFSLVVYDSDDGSQVQTINLDFTVGQFKGSGQIIDCTDKYLSFVDIKGSFRVFEYSHPFPVWAIIVIVVGGVLIIGGAVGFFIWRKKKMQKTQNQGYQQFNNQQY